MKPGMPAIASRCLRALAAVLLACLLTRAAIAAAPPPNSLGRLFMTPEQRERLEARRQLKAVEVSTAQNEAAEEEAPVASYLTVQGQVLRSDGRQTIFINGTPYAADESPKGTQLVRGRRAGEVVIVPADNAPPVRLKVGQSLDKNTLTVDDSLLRAGTISIGNAHSSPLRRAAAPR
jgi:hypothetical protein